MKVCLAVPIIGGRDLDRGKSIASVINAVGHEVASPWVLKEDPGFLLPTTEVFKRDLAAVEASDILVAEITSASHGVGMKMMAAYFHGKPIILLYKASAMLSRMLLGIPGATLLEYASAEEITKKLMELLRSKR